MSNVINVKLREHPKHHDVFVDKNTGVVYQKLAATLSEHGYKTIKLKRNVTVRRHTIVCETFHGLPPARGAHVRHLDGDPNNDKPNNLRWGTPKQNAVDMICHGRSTIGERNPSAKLTKQQALEIRRRSKTESTKALAIEFFISPSSVSDIKVNRTWK